jgi:hypothetical protein
MMGYEVGTIQIILVIVSLSLFLLSVADTVRRAAFGSRTGKFAFMKRISFTLFIVLLCCSGSTTGWPIHPPDK